MRRATCTAALVTAFSAILSLGATASSATEVTPPAPPLEVGYYGGPHLREHLTTLQEKILGTYVVELEHEGSGTDEMLWFEFMPPPAWKLPVRRVRVSAVPDPFFDVARKRAVANVEAMVFVASAATSQREKTTDAWESLQYLLGERGAAIAGMPVVVELDRCGQGEALSVKQAKAMLGISLEPVLEADSRSGYGLLEVLRNVLQRASAKPPAKSRP